METLSSIEKAAQPWKESPPIPTSGDENHEALLEKQYAEMRHRFPLTAPKHGLEKLTIYGILGQSPDMAKMFEKLQQHPDLVALLNDSASECTVWAPTNHAFSQLEGDIENWMAILQHHISPYPLPVSRLLQMGNIPTSLCPAESNGSVRLRVRPTIAGIQVNKASVTKSDIMASNGVVHVVDAVLLPPPSMMTVIAELPDASFSIAQHALHKTCLDVDINSTIGGTMFLPSNSAFEKLGVEANKFLFDTDEGEKYLEALLRFHFASAQTLSSNSLYRPKGNSQPAAQKPHEGSVPAAVVQGHSKGNELDLVRKGTKRFPLSTSLAGHDLLVSITRYGSVIDMLPNKWTPVTIQDCIANNGVVHLVNGVLLPVDEKAAENVDLADLKAMFDDSI